MLRLLCGNSRVGGHKWTWGSPRGLLAPFSDGDGSRGGDEKWLGPGRFCPCGWVTSGWKKRRGQQ